MKVVDKEPIEKKEQSRPGRVKNFFKFKNSLMVRIEGNYFGGGFNMSKNKVKDILENKDILLKFVNGEFDEEISKLEENQALEV